MDEPVAAAPLVKKKRRRKKKVGRGPIEVRIGAKRWYCFDVGYVACGILLMMEDQQILLPALKLVTIIGAAGQINPPARMPSGNSFGPDLSVDSLLERNRESAEDRRKQEIAEFNARRNGELEEATHAGGALAFHPSLV